MKKMIAILFFTLPVILCYSQTSNIRGVIVDTSEFKNLSNAVVSILRNTDSVLVSFTRTDKEGRFSLNKINEGFFIMMITHPYMGDWFDQVEVSKGNEHDLGKIYMIPKIKLLAEVILKSGSPIRIKGDTTIYTADSFRVRPGANVEELLRRLPGIQVDQNGQITAMGERVRKVLVDGEEFFGSDPGIATKNLRADAVKEVQVFDKKSDQAEFTGIDDGVKDKTINLKMKEMKGYFGKVESGGGLKDKYNNAVMLNNFKGKRKIAGYGILSNTGQTNLNWRDAQNYGGGADNMQVSDDGGIMIFQNSDNESFWGGRNGIPQNSNAGFHYSNKLNKDKLSFNSGYRYSKVNAAGSTTTFSQNYLPDTSWSGNSRNISHANTEKHAFNLTLDANIDSANSLKWTTRINKNISGSKSSFYSEALNEAGAFINSSARNSNNNAERNNITSSLLWKHKFKKLSRTLSINTDFNWSESNSNGLLYSLNNYYSGGALLRKDTTDQQNIQNNENSSISARVAYTEPLMKDTYLEFSHSVSFNTSSNDRITNIKNINGKYEEPVDSLSNAFEFNRLVNTPGLNFKINKKKYNFSFGSSVGFSHFVQKNITNKSMDDYDFINYFPQASFTYKFKPSENFRFSYNGSTTAPTLEQLQPTRINTDPLNIYKGNPDLRQSFRHSINTSYNSYAVLKEKNIWANMYGNFTQNAFVQSSIVDSVGIRNYQTVNANGVYFFNFYGNYGFKVTKSKIFFGFGPSGSISRNIDFINGIKNLTKMTSYGIQFNINKYVAKKYNFYFSPSISWKQSEGTVNKNANAEYWQIENWANVNVHLPKNFELNSDFNLQVGQKDPRYSQNNNYSIWNASVIKRLLKDNALEIKFGVYDILNQNKGYQRNFNSYSFSESYYETLRRYWLLTLTWNISKNGKPAGFN